LKLVVVGHSALQQLISLKVKKQLWGFSLCQIEFVFSLWHYLPRLRLFLCKSPAQWGFYIKIIVLTYARSTITGNFNDKLASLRSGALSLTTRAKRSKVIALLVNQLLFILSLDLVNSKIKSKI
jgi:hypothetical protein